MTKQSKEVKQIIKIETLCKMFDVQHPDDYQDWLCSNYNVWDSELSEEENQANEEAYMTETCTKYYDALVQACRDVFDEHDMELTELEWGKYEVTPSTNRGWRAAAQKVIATINGAGPFYFSSIREFVLYGPYDSLAQAVMAHIGWLSDWATVYGMTSVKSKVDHAMRY